MLDPDKVYLGKLLYFALSATNLYRFLKYFKILQQIYSHAVRGITFLLSKTMITKKLL